MKVYVVMKGHYSDRHIVCVKTDRKVAQDIVDRINSANEYSNYSESYLEVYDTDQNIESRFLYEFEFNDRGNLTNYHFDGLCEHDENCENDIFRGYFGYIVCQVFTTSRDRAEKIAYDMLAEFLAKENGIS